MTAIAKASTNNPSRTLLYFLMLTFGLSWGIIALLILFTEQLVAIFGEMSIGNPLYILAVYAPGIVGVLLVWRLYGSDGLRRFFRRLTLWRMPGLWWLYLIVGIPTIVYASAAIKVWTGAPGSGTIGDLFFFAPWQQVLSAVVLALFLGPIEEFGWRGLALPLLQRKMVPFWAGLTLGIIWATWHIPAFLLSGTPQSAWSFTPFFAGVVAISVILMPMFNASRGSILIAILYHFQMMNPIFPDAQPWDNYLFILIAIVIVWVKRDEMFSREAGVTDVLMPQ